MEEVYDQFPINLLETGGKIAREPLALWYIPLTFGKTSIVLLIKG